MLRTACVLATLLFLHAGAGNAQAYPVPPCGSAAQPTYSQPGQQPNVSAWAKGQLTDWTPPACVGQRAENREIVLALSGSFTHEGTSEDLLARFGRLSALRGVRY